MGSKFNIIFILILCCSNLTAQIFDAKFIVEYDFKYKKDDSLWSKPEKFILIGNSKESFYLNYIDFKNDSVVYHNLGEWYSHGKTQEMNQKFLDKSMKLVNEYANQNLKVYKDYTKNQLICARQEGWYYVSGEDMSLVWELTEDEEIINGLKCQKASTNYGGRTFYAFYAQDIPINDGPYKFNNLPGLIIKVVDSKGLYKFEFIRMREAQKLYVKQKFITSNQSSLPTREQKVLMLKKLIENPHNHMPVKFDEQTTIKYIDRMKKRKDLLIEIE